MIDRETVASVLREFGLRCESTIHGFELPGDGNFSLKRGGGIAGRSGEWWIEKRGRSYQTRIVSTRRDLWRLLTEWMAGEPPAPRPGYVLFARRESNRFGDSYNWRERRAPSEPGKGGGRDG